MHWELPTRGCNCVANSSSAASPASVRLVSLIRLPLLLGPGALVSIQHTYDREVTQGRPWTVVSPGPRCGRSVPRLRLSGACAHLLQKFNKTQHTEGDSLSEGDLTCCTGKLCDYTWGERERCPGGRFRRAPQVPTGKQEAEGLARFPRHLSSS